MNTGIPVMSGTSTSTKLHHREIIVVLIAYAVLHKLWPIDGGGKA